MEIGWAKRDDGTWFDLGDGAGEELLIDGKKGVFVVFHAALVVAVGGGGIAEGLARTRKELQTRLSSELQVTWAEVEPNQIEGVERFLLDQMAPLTGGRVLNCRPVAVNLPM